MSDLYEGKADARQSAAPAVKPEHSLFQKRYRQLSPEEVAFHDAIKDKADELAGLIGCLNPVVADVFGIALPKTRDGILQNRPYDGGNVTLAIRHLEDAVYRAVKALTA